MIPVRGFDASDPTPIPPAPMSHHSVQYPSKPPVVVLYLRSPATGDALL